MAQAVACACASWLGTAYSQAPDPGLALRMSTELSAQRRAAEDSLPTFLRSERMTIISNRETRLTGDAELRRGTTVLRGDEIRYDQVDDAVQAQGQVRLLRNGSTYTGPHLRYELDRDRGAMGPGEFTLASNGGRIDAERTEFINKELLKFNNTRYTTCRRGDDSWYLNAASIEVDNVEGIGKARNAYVVFQGIPVLASPYLQFPVNDERRSGFLTPSVGASSIRGAEVDAPYYWNIASNRDYTLTPRVMTKRGVQFGNEFRYLEPSYNGVTVADIVPNDKRTGTHRWAFESRHSQVFDRRWSGYWNIARASDDRYFDEYSRSLVPIASRQLVQEGSVSYGASWWSASARVQKFQVLQNADRSISTPYERTPQITWRGQRYDVGGFDIGAEFDYTRFVHPTLINAERSVLTSSASYPVIFPAWYITPKLAMNLASYTFENAQPRFHRAIPTLSLDSGLTFERDSTWWGTALIQTFEPRLFYVRTPYRDQTRAPIFDSGIPDLNFAQLFTENRFSGLDRVGDANQLTVALSSRFIEPDSGNERLRVTLGQRFFFTDPRVELTSSTTPTTPSTARKSDFLMSLGGQITQAISADATAQFDAATNRITRSSLGTRYTVAPGQFISTTYRLVRDAVTTRRTLEQFDVAGQWRLSGRWLGVARINYSALDRNVTESILGLEYREDCWAVRAVLQRFPTGTGAKDTSIFFQLDLNGLASVGSSPLEALRRNIPGYRPINEPNPTLSPLQQLQ